VRRLIKVVFPAPFGPMMEVKTPSSTRRSTSSVALTTPKYFRSFSVLSSSATAPIPSPGLFHQRQDPFHGEDHNSTTENEDQEDNDQSQADEPILGESDDDVLNEIEENRTNDRSRKAVYPSEESNKDRFGRLGPVGKRWGHGVFKRW